LLVIADMTQLPLLQIAPAARDSQSAFVEHRPCSTSNEHAAEIMAIAVTASPDRKLVASDLAALGIRSAIALPLLLVRARRPPRRRSSTRHERRRT
jgi:hypothetical protein